MGEMNDGLRDTASFASLTNWGKSWRDVAKGTKRKGKGWRQRTARTRETLRYPVARGHNLQHLLAVIDQRKRRGGNGVWADTG
ncbi:hypothetical protein CgunFtcFv8_011872 [Champsocephalus gunnari]|uniref:Uncharacterized protein n=1 Tax=Champsocephalus gunnari TaxID=52237 RepID=A0AAN8HIF6_CHAGU|nr:hypothetical protein CgunFtcFv8_011872 [Champsocephalus gunnari]